MPHQLPLLARVKCLLLLYHMQVDARVSPYKQHICMDLCLMPVWIRKVSTHQSRFYYFRWNLDINHLDIQACTIYCLFTKKFENYKNKSIIWLNSIFQPVTLRTHNLINLVCVTEILKMIGMGYTRFPLHENWWWINNSEADKKK